MDLKYEKFFDFPLCSLQFLVEERKYLNYIMSYCVITRANNIDYSIEDMNYKIENIFSNREFPADYNKSPLEKKIIIASHELGVIIHSIQRELHDHYELKAFIDKYELNFGKDSYCRMGKNLTFEARDGQFDFRQYLVLCAISSIIGKKKKFVRITYDRIRYAMYGFRSKKIFEQDTPPIKLLTDRQLKRVVDILHSKKFFSKFTYGNRQIYYSTKLEDNQLMEAVKNSKIYWKRKQLQTIDRSFSNEIKDELEKISLEALAIREQTRTNAGRHLKLVKAN